MKIKDSIVVNFVFPQNIAALKIKELLLLAYAKVVMDISGVLELNANQDHAQVPLLSIIA